MDKRKEMMQRTFDVRVTLQYLSDKYGTDCGTCPLSRMSGCLEAMDAAGVDCRKVKILSAIFEQPT